ncbi:unknown [Bacteroides stercoris CAG:120]|nr:unknown [Bacteroides stercoris CAG:120]
MILIVPPTALAPNSAEPPPRTTSTLSIMFTGICSSPYTPLSALMTGRLFIRICEYGPSRPLIRTWGKPQFWQLFSTRRPDW